MTENIAKNNVVMDLGRFRIIYAMKGNPHGHADIVCTRTAKEVGVEDAEDDAYFIRVIREDEDRKKLYEQTRLIADHQPLNIDEIIEFYPTANTTLRNKKGKCIGVCIENSGKYEWYFFNSEKEFEQILPVIHPKIFLLMKFLVVERAIVDYRVVCLSKTSMRIEMTREVGKKKQNETIVAKCEVRKVEEIIQLIWVEFYEGFAAKEYTTKNKYFFTKFYNEAAKKMQRWQLWAKENLQK